MPRSIQGQPWPQYYEQVEDERSSPESVNMSQRTVYRTVAGEKWSCQFRIRSSHLSCEHNPLPHVHTCEITIRRRVNPNQRSRYQRWKVIERLVYDCTELPEAVALFKGFRQIDLNPYRALEVL